MEMISDSQKLIGLVRQAHEGKICLPKFQRPFVWRRNDVADLIRSVLRGYYIGSLLLLSCDPNKPPFAPSFLGNEKETDVEPHPDFLVLDGQQRLTALLYSLTAPNYRLKATTQRRFFFINLKVLLEDINDDEIVFDRTETELDGLLHLDDLLNPTEKQYENLVLPCTVLFKEEAYQTWRDGLDDWLKDNDPPKHLLYRQTWRSRWDKVFWNFLYFNIPLIQLPGIKENDTYTMGQVCAIFEKLNSTGVPLSVYDLLTAKLFRFGIDLHKLWKDACKDNTKLKDWSDGKAEHKVFGILVLRTLALLRNVDPSPNELINLKSDNFEKDWKRAAQAMEHALELIELVDADGFCVFDKKWLPGTGLLPVLAALRAEINERHLDDDARADLRRWYWSNVFLERYSSAVESKSRKDYSEMLAHWLDSNKPEPTVFAEAQARIGAEGYTVRGSTSYSGALYSGVFCLLALLGAKDWRLRETIRLQNLQDHHVFPQKYLKDHGIDTQSQVNTVLNRTLISDKTNNLIKAKAPADYLTSVQIFPNGRDEKLMKPHFMSNATVEIALQAGKDLPDGVIATYYEAFTKAREAEIVAEIRHRCGVNPPSAGV